MKVNSVALCQMTPSFSHFPHTRTRSFATVWRCRAYDLRLTDTTESDLVGTSFDLPQPHTATTTQYHLFTDDELPFRRAIPLPLFRTCRQQSTHDTLPTAKRSAQKWPPARANANSSPLRLSRRSGPILKAYATTTKRTPHFPNRPHSPSASHHQCRTRCSRCSSTWACACARVCRRGIRRRIRVLSFTHALL